MINDLGIFRGLMGKMAFTDHKATVIAQNVANADTPGYRAKMLKDPDFASVMALAGPKTGETLRMQATNDGHVGGIKGRPYTDPRASLQRTVYEAAPNDNAVVLEEQMFMAAKNAADQQMAANLFRRCAGMYRMALQGSGR